MQKVALILAVTLIPVTVVPASAQVGNIFRELGNIADGVQNIVDEIEDQNSLDSEEKEEFEEYRENPEEEEEFYQSPPKRLENTDKYRLIIK
jgi:hypothetical protein